MGMIDGKELDPVDAPDVQRRVVVKVTDAARRLVYVIGDRNVVQARPVELGPVIDGLRVIRSGITAKDRVVVGGIQRAMPGKPAKIEAGRIGADGKVVPAKAAAKPAAAGAAAGKGGAQ